MLTETTTRYRLAVDAPGASDAQRAESDALASAVRSHGVRRLARGVGLSPQFLCLWLAGRRTIDGEALTAIRRELAIGEPTGTARPPQGPRSLPATSDPDEPRGLDSVLRPPFRGYQLR